MAMNIITTVKKLFINFLKKRGWVLKKMKDIDRIALFFFRVLDMERKKSPLPGVSAFSIF
jgi:hypothetical protein